MGHFSPFSSDSSAVNFFLDDHNNKEDMLKALHEIPFMYGTTHTAQALRVIRNEMFRESRGDRPGNCYH